MKNSKVMVRAGVLIGTMLIIALVAGVFMSAFAQTDHRPPSDFADPVVEGFLKDYFADLCLEDVFDVGGHGPKSWPVPSEDAVVMCLNSEGEWVTNTITNQSVSCVDGVCTIYFTSSQHGTCGIFTCVTGDVGAPVIE